MLIRNLLIGAITLCAGVSGLSAAHSADSMRGATAVQINTKYSSTVAMAKDHAGNIISFHVNGISPTDAGILLTHANSPLSTEFTVVSGVSKEGGIMAYMLPTNIATAHVIENISKDLVNAGSISVHITKQLTGKM